MNKNRGRLPQISVVLLILLLLFKGAAAAAMLCCGPDHSAHSASHSQLSAAEHSMTEHHGQHSVQHGHSGMPDAPELHYQEESQKLKEYLMTDQQQFSCTGCAVSCAAAVLMCNPDEFISEMTQNERFLCFTPFIFPLIASGLERPPRLHS